jgi:hypothetical protein
VASLKVYENRLRRMAQRQMMRIEKSRRRDPHAAGYGGYQLIETYQNSPVLGWAFDATLEQIEAYLANPQRPGWRKAADGEMRWHIPQTPATPAAR